MPRDRDSKRDGQQRDGEAREEDWTGDHDWVTTRQAADFLQLHVRTIQRYARDGAIQHARVGGRVRLRRIDVERLLGHAIPEEDVADNYEREEEES
jgi:excisionase family DNA binding protein